MSLRDEVTRAMLPPWSEPCGAVAADGVPCERLWHARPGGGVHVGAGGRTWAAADTWTDEVIGAPLGALEDVEWKAA